MTITIEEIRALDDITLLLRLHAHASSSGRGVMEIEELLKRRGGCVALQASENPK